MSNDDKNTSASVHQRLLNKARENIRKPKYPDQSKPGGFRFFLKNAMTN